MAYTGPARTQYIAAGGLPIDKMQARSLIDPTPAALSLFTDIDRLQWGVLHDWGHPPIYVNVECRDGGTTGTSGSFAAQDKVFGLAIEVPPAVKHASVCAVMSGAIKVKITNAGADTTGIQLTNSAGGGATSFIDPQASKMVWATGVSNYPALEPRALILRTSHDIPITTQMTLEVTVTRTDTASTNEGFGGMLWGLGFQWDRPPLDTFLVGTDSAYSASV